jgi:predicted ATPase
VLSGVRLVTLTGAGGIGKTRLALEVAAKLVTDYEDGVWLVELAGLQDPELVPHTVLTAFGLIEQPRKAPTESLINFLAARQVLCVLDNCEHLVNACAQLAGTLLKHCSGLRILATSRDVLRVDGEVTWRVPSLTTPDAERPYTLDELQRCETVQLLVQRANAARPGFRVSDGNASAVARICQRLEGIPLAIELVAARTRSMSISAIDERIDDQFTLLTGGSRVAMPRQRTLQATFDWSLGLLCDEERTVFRRLSVFAGGFPLEAAEAVCGEDGTERRDTAVLDTLTSLVDKSLVLSQPDAGRSGRYRLLEPIRQYAHEQLSEAHEVDAARRSHARFFLALGDDAYRELRGQSQVGWMARVVEELDNFRACFNWALSGDPPAALQLCVALDRYWNKNSTGEGREWLSRALDVYTDQDELRAHALYDATTWAHHRGYFDEARRLGQECLELAERLGSDLYVGEALTVLGAIEADEGADGWAARSLSLHEEAEPHLREADDPDVLAWFLNSHGYTLFLAGKLVAARPKVEEALAWSRGRDDTLQIEAVLDSLACIEFESGETVAAGAHWKEQLEIGGQLGSRGSVACALVGLARLAVAGHERPERYLRLVSAASCFMQLSGDILPQFAQTVAKIQYESRALLGDEVSDTIWREGAKMSLAEAVRFGLDDTIQPEPDLPRSGPPVRGADAVGESAFICEGDFWSLAYGGVVVRLKDSKGLRDLAQLLGMPGREVAAVELASGGRIGSPRRAAALGEFGLGVEGDVGEALDAQARAQYGARLADLEDDVSQAEANNDPERASRAREEREFLLTELGAALGLGGRARRALDPAERARKAVTWRTRDAISHIEAAHADLGRHLRRSVRTGSFCVYAPPEPTGWHLRP